MLIRPFLIILAGSALVALALAVHALGNSVKLLCPACFAMDAVAENVYVDPALEPRDRERLLAMVGRARDRVAQVLGPVEARPVIVACASWQCFAEFGGLVPLPGQPAMKANALADRYIRLSPIGHDDYVLAHELAHAELHHRLGTRIAFHALPTWFDEGLAMIISGDPQVRGIRAAPASAEPLDLATLVSPQAWHKAALAGQPVYQHAYVEVARWYAIVGRDGVAQLIARLRAGEDFAKTYAEIAGWPVPERAQRPRPAALL